MVRCGSDHWIKTGIEFVDGQAKLSCVVTNGYSDWSTQPWQVGQSSGSKFSLRLRVSQMGNGSYVVEAGKTGSGELQFIRICQLHLPFSTDEVQVGVFACCPEEQEGCSVTFSNFFVQKGVKFEHSADGNLE